MATRTVSSTASVPRVTPPPECRHPDAEARGGYCAGGAWGFYATGWRGCPSGYTSACGTTTGGAPFRYNPDATPYEQGGVRTRYHQIVCCPDSMEWECAPGNSYTSCTAIATADVTFPYPTELTRFTMAYSAPSGALLDVVGITVSSAIAEQHFSYASYPGLGRTSIDETVTRGAWCDLPVCEDVTFKATVPTAAAQGVSLLPPPKTGQLGSMGIFAISGLVGAVIFAAAALLPTVQEYRRRKRAQR